MEEGVTVGRTEANKVELRKGYLAQAKRIGRQHMVEHKNTSQKP